MNNRPVAGTDGTARSQVSQSIFCPYLNCYGGDKPSGVEEFVWPWAEPSGPAQSTSSYAAVLRRRAPKARSASPAPTSVMLTGSGTDVSSRMLKAMSTPGEGAQVPSKHC